MKNLQFDFIVNKEDNTIRIIKEFAADKPLIWDVYTKSEYLDQWWAPEPWKTKTKQMNFAEGGRWLYAMIGPNGENNWCCFDYQKIQRLEIFTALDAFCDEAGNINKQFPRTHWELRFTEINQNTLVKSVLTYNSLQDLETILSYGFQEGITIGMEKLEKFIETLKLKRNEKK